MQKRRLIYIPLLLLSSVALIVGLIASFNSETDKLKVIFFDVGQGDAILISAGSNQVLIDGGMSGKLLLEKMGKYVPFWDRQIETVIVTHPDKDHIGGLIDVLSAYKIGAIIETKSESKSQIFKAWKAAIFEENANMVEATKGLKINVSDNAVAEIIYPVLSGDDFNVNKTNENSIALRLDYGENSFLFAGDLPSEQEDLLDVSDIDFLKVSHHGSKYSTSYDFLNKVNPNEAILSVGKNNKYGHPSEDVLERLMDKRIEIRRTDEDGDIIYACNTTDIKCRLVAN